jgi:hypothetical protein
MYACKAIYITGGCGGNIEAGDYVAVVVEMGRATSTLWEI